MKRILLLLALGGTVISGAGAAVTLATEDFTYPDGSLVPNGGWDNHSGNAGDLLISGNAALVQHGVPSEDANLTFASQSAGILTAAFDIVVNDDTPIGGSDFEYFAHFFTEGSFNFRARVDIVPATLAGADFTLGISSSTSTAEATLANDFNYGDTIAVALAFDLDTGTASLTVGAETISGSASGAGQTLDSLGLRQSDSSNNESISVDNLVITSSIPEPSAFALVGIAGLLGILRRRR